MLSVSYSIQNNRCITVNVALLFFFSPLNLRTIYESTIVMLNDILNPCQQPSS